MDHFGGKDDGKQMLHKRGGLVEQRCGAHTSSVCEADVSQVLTRKRTELRRGSQCAFVCSLTYKAVRVLGAQAAAGTFTMAAVADVRPEASTVTLLCTHRLSHCAGSEKKRILKVWHTHAQPQYHQPQPSCHTAGARKLRRVRNASRNKLEASAF